MTKPTVEVAPSAAPPHALLIWCDLTRIYVQMPSMHGPCVIDYPRDAHSISDILNLMKSRHATEYAGAAYVKPERPHSLKSVPVRDPRFDNRQRTVVAELLRRKGITGGSR